MLKRFRSHFYCPTTNFVDKEVTKIIREDNLSLDQKRAQFKSTIKSYYNSNADKIKSEELVRRLSEIDSFEKFDRNILIPSILGAFIGLFVSEITANLPGIALHSNELLSTLIMLLLSIVLVLVPALFLSAIVIYFAFQAKELRYYEQLHLEDYERQIIEGMLKKRLKEIEENRENPDKIKHLGKMPANNR